MYTAQEIISTSLKNSRLMIQSNMSVSGVWLIRGLLAIYRNQTVDEQTNHITRYNNRIGFTGLDASILTSFSQQIKKWQHECEMGTNKFDRPLSDRQMRILNDKMQKYAGQLSRIARQNATRQTTQC